MKLNLRTILQALAVFILSLTGGAAGGEIEDRLDPQPTPEPMGITLPLPELPESIIVEDLSEEVTDALIPDPADPAQLKRAPRALWRFDLLWEKTDSATPDTDRFYDQRYLIARGSPSADLIKKTIDPYWPGYTIARILNRTKIREYPEPDQPGPKPDPEKPTLRE